MFEIAIDEAAERVHAERSIPAACNTLGVDSRSMALLLLLQDDELGLVLSYLTAMSLSSMGSCCTQLSSTVRQHVQLRAPEAMQRYEQSVKELAWFYYGFSSSHLGRLRAIAVAAALPKPGDHLGDVTVNCAAANGDEHRQVMQLRMDATPPFKISGPSNDWMLDAEDGGKLDECVSHVVDGALDDSLALRFALIWDVHGVVEERDDEEPVPPLRFDYTLALNQIKFVPAREEAGPSLKFAFEGTWHIIDEAGLRFPEEEVEDNVRGRAVLHMLRPIC